MLGSRCEVVVVVYCQSRLNTSSPAISVSSPGARSHAVAIRLHFDRVGAALCHSPSPPRLIHAAPIDPRRRLLTSRSLACFRCLAVWHASDATLLISSAAYNLLRSCRYLTFALSPLSTLIPLPQTWAFQPTLLPSRRLRTIPILQTSLCLPLAQTHSSRPPNHRRAPPPMPSRSENWLPVTGPNGVSMPERTA